MLPSPASEELALAALEWIDATAVTDGEGVWWSGKPSSAEPDPTLYDGIAGIILALLEAHAHFGDPRWAELALRVTRWLAADMDAFDAAGYPSLYFGAAGMALALHEAAERLGDDRAGDARVAATRGLARLLAAFNGERWGDAFELMGGNVGIALAALRIGDAELAEAAVAPYLRTAEVTAYGQTWEQRRGQPARRHHISHGTLGIAYGLAVVGTAVGRGDLVDAALAGVADVVARNEAGPGGFLVPHSDPQQVAFGLERYSYGWCHGPAGDAQVFRLLGQLADGARGPRDARDASDARGASGAGEGSDTSVVGWRALADRCWHTVTTSGLPERLRPGFWDNSGRCCGTGGVLALALDREVEAGDGLAFADLLVADLARRATVDASGARWSNVEYRASPPELEPRPGWAMGNAGLIRELLRHARITAGRDPSYAVQWPDHPAPVQGAPGQPSEREMSG
ncbi:MAG: lanthionine synthetase LanC family protein [Solirubrobacteraceae bacterium]